MKTWLFFMAMIPILGYCQNLNFPNSGKDLRIARVYWKGGENLKIKYQYYFDPWSEQEIRHGKRSLWDKKGRLRQEQIYQDGVLHGLSVERRKNGSLRRKGTYLRGKREGTWEYFNRSGTRTKAQSFQGGEKQGPPEFYTPSGSKKSNRFFGPKKSSPSPTA